MTIDWPWILLIGLFLAMHLFGIGCCRHHKRGQQDNQQPDAKGDKGSSESCH